MDEVNNHMATVSAVGGKALHTEADTKPLFNQVYFEMGLCILAPGLKDKPNNGWSVAQCGVSRAHLLETLVAADRFAEHPVLTVLRDYSGAVVAMLPAQP